MPSIRSNAPPKVVSPQIRPVRPRRYKCRSVRYGPRRQDELGMQFHLEKSLLDYLIATDDMQKDTARYNPKYVELFNDLDLHWRNEVLRGELDLDPIAAFLLGHSYFLWLASVRTALSGHSMSVFPVLRTSLESACYGYMVAHDPSARRCWLDRDQSPETFKKFRRRFNQAIRRLKTNSRRTRASRIEHHQFLPWHDHVRWTSESSLFARPCQNRRWRH